MGRHLAVIPARGGSKRLPRKNIIGFLGKPIIAYTIEAAKQSGIFNRILVSTEDKEIAEVSASYDCEVDFRPQALSTDSATITQVCLELLGRLELTGERYETLTVLFATAPLRNAADIRATHALLSPPACEFAMAVTDFAQPVHQALIARDDRSLEPVFPQAVSTRASEMPRYVAGNGSTYCVNVDSFRANPGWYGRGLKGYIIPRERAVDIDTIDDFRLAEFYAKQTAR